MTSTDAALPSAMTLERDGPIAPSRRVRVMHVTENLGAGGLEQVVVTLCRTVDRSRFDPSVLCLRFIGELAEKLSDLDIPVLQLPSRPGKANYLAFRDVARIMRSQRVDVVHTHNTGAFLDGSLGALAAGVRTIVHTEHGRVFPDKLRYMLAERALSHFAYRFVGVSEPMVDGLRRYERISREKLEMIPNGIELDAYSCRIDRARKRRELELPDQGPILGVTARLAQPKGITYLLKALPRLCTRFPDLSILIAGTGNLFDGLNEEARQLGVGDRVRFLGLRLDIPELLQLFDVYVLPSISEGMPMSLIEAMAAGCAVVASDVGGIGNMIRSEESGLLVKSRSPDALSDAITRLLLDPQLRRRFGEAAARTAHARFSAAAMTRRYERLYLRDAE